MVEIREYLRYFIDQLHGNYEKALADLTADEWRHRPGPETNHIGFTAWHWVRTEDNVVNFVLQRKNTVWLDQGLDQNWQLPKAAQGTGMPREEAHAMTVPPPAEFLPYARAVWQSTAPYYAALTPDELDRVVRVMPFGEIPVLQALGQILIAHGNQHLGEIWLTRELQGKSGQGF
ncbi:MAG TPA: DinB family protein [Dehalococcoidia bacterium]|nr:DinB family protein [Dehalococcoidia bacterium]